MYCSVPQPRRLNKWAKARRTIGFQPVATRPVHQNLRYLAAVIGARDQSSRLMTTNGLGGRTSPGCLGLQSHMCGTSSTRPMLCGFQSTRRPIAQSLHPPPHSILVIRPDGPVVSRFTLSASGGRRSRVGARVAIPYHSGFHGGAKAGRLSLTAGEIACREHTVISGIGTSSPVIPSECHVARLTPRFGPLPVPGRPSHKGASREKIFAEARWINVYVRLAVFRNE